MTDIDTGIGRGGWYYGPDKVMPSVNQAIREAVYSVMGDDATDDEITLIAKRAEEAIGWVES